jgi:hypothetical protein
MRRSVTNITSSSSTAFARALQSARSIGNLVIEASQVLAELVDSLLQLCLGHGYRFCAAAGITRKSL